MAVHFRPTHFRHIHPGKIFLILFDKSTKCHYFRLDYYKMKINSTNSNRTIVSANIGVPDDDLKNSFLKRFVLSQGKQLFLIT